MIEETQRLKDSGISWKRLDGFGLEYRWTSRYLRGKVSYQEMFDALLRDIIKFSKKQMIWFNYDKDIIWIKNYREAIPEIDSFLQKKERKSSFVSHFSATMSFKDLTKSSAFISCLSLDFTLKRKIISLL